MSPPEKIKFTYSHEKNVFVQWGNEKALSEETAKSQEAGNEGIGKFDPKSVTVGTLELYPQGEGKLPVVVVREDPSNQGNTVNNISPILAPVVMETFATKNEETNQYTPSPEQLHWYEISKASLEHPDIGNTQVSFRQLGWSEGQPDAVVECKREAVSRQEIAANIDSTPLTLEGVTAPEGVRPKTPDPPSIEPEP